MGRHGISVEQRIAENIEIDSNGCWIWLKHKDNNGYGRIWANSKTLRAHRVSYETYVGPISEGLELDHLCRVRHCVNPLHLESVTHAENMRRGDHSNKGKNNAIKTHCLRGHEYTEENTYRYKNGRYCRACNSIRAFANYHRE